MSASLWSVAAEHGFELPYTSEEIAAVFAWRQDRVPVGIKPASGAAPTPESVAATLASFSLGSDAAAPASASAGRVNLSTLPLPDSLPPLPTSSTPDGGLAALASALSLPLPSFLSLVTYTVRGCGPDAAAALAVADGNLLFRLATATLARADPFPTAPAPAANALPLAQPRGVLCSVDASLAISSASSASSASSHVAAFPAVNAAAVLSQVTPASLLSERSRHFALGHSLGAYTRIPLPTSSSDASSAAAAAAAAVESGLPAGAFATTTALTGTWVPSAAVSAAGLRTDRASFTDADVFAAAVALLQAVLAAAPRAVGRLLAASRLTIHSPSSVASTAGAAIGPAAGAPSSEVPVAALLLRWLPSYCAASLSVAGSGSAGHDATSPNAASAAASPLAAPGSGSASGGTPSSPSAGAGASAGANIGSHRALATLAAAITSASAAAAATAAAASESSPSASSVGSELASAAHSLSVLPEAALLGEAMATHAATGADYSPYSYGPDDDDNNAANEDDEDGEDDAAFVGPGYTVNAFVGNKFPAFIGTLLPPLLAFYADEDNDRSARHVASLLASAAADADATGAATGSSQTIVPRAAALAAAPAQTRRELLDSSLTATAASLLALSTAAAGAERAGLLSGALPRVRGSLYGLPAAAVTAAARFAVAPALGHGARAVFDGAVGALAALAAAADASSAAGSSAGAVAADAVAAGPGLFADVITRVAADASEAAAALAGALPDAPPAQKIFSLAAQADAVSLSTFGSPFPLFRHPALLTAPIAPIPGAGPLLRPSSVTHLFLPALPASAVSLALVETLNAAASEPARLGQPGTGAVTRALALVLHGTVTASPPTGTAGAAAAAAAAAAHVGAAAVVTAAAAALCADAAALAAGLATPAALRAALIGGDASADGRAGAEGEASVAAAVTDAGAALTAFGITADAVAAAAAALDSSAAAAAGAVPGRAQLGLVYAGDVPVLIDVLTRWITDAADDAAASDPCFVLAAYTLAAVVFHWDGYRAGTGQGHRAGEVKAALLSAAAAVASEEVRQQQQQQVQKGGPLGAARLGLGALVHVAVTAALARL